MRGAEVQYEGGEDEGRTVRSLVVVKTHLLYLEAH